MNEAFSIMVANDDDHERVFAEIYVGDKFVALVSQEGGPGTEQVELPGPGLDEGLILRKISLAVFQDAIQAAIGRLNS